MGMFKQALMAIGALCLCVGATRADELGPRVVSKPEMSPQQTMVLHRLEARSATLRRAWLTSGRGAEAAPAIIAGKLLTPNLNVAIAPAAPEISVKFQAAAGLSVITACIASNTTTQQICFSYQAPYGPKAPTEGNLKVEQPFGVGLGDGSLTLYSAPGAWSLSFLSITDMSGASVDYDQSQIATLFPGGSTINVTNSGTPDTSPPVLLAGKVLTRIVKLSSAYPGFGADLTVSDNLSGIGITCVVVSDPDGNEYYCDENLPPSPHSREVHAGTYIGASAATGAYTITSYFVCDVAGNCLFDSNSADIQSLFGATTFKVEN
jgi:hypothetical protein